ncbi:polyprenyl synthetase [Spirochaetia bacterium]|nr:polyprenyl synthetase [Spirochaetia bacterium]GHU32744.1 polyprenyl synthetase [Spirochaetia bacterium]
MTLVCECLHGGDKALPLVPLVEFAHQASLIHDDIEDNSPKRRGEQAIHLKYGLDTAVNAGSFLYFLPLSVIESWNASPEKKMHIFSRWSSALKKLHLGQSLDIQWHRDCSAFPTVEEYLTMCRLKTGTLARLSAELGALTAEAPEMAPAFGHAAETLGLGFQILDDVQNLNVGNPGKLHGDDIVEGKKSLPVILYLHTHPESMVWVADCFAIARSEGGSAVEIEKFVQTLEAEGALDEAQHHGILMVEEAQEAFSVLIADAPQESRELLLDVLKWVGGIPDAG